MNIKALIENVKINIWIKLEDDYKIINLFELENFNENEKTIIMKELEKAYKYITDH